MPLSSAASPAGAFPDGFTNLGPLDPQPWGGAGTWILWGCLVLVLAAAVGIGWAWRRGVSRFGTNGSRARLALLCACALVILGAGMTAQSVASRFPLDAVTGSAWGYSGTVTVVDAHEGQRGREWVDVRLGSGQTQGTTPVVRLDLISREALGGAANGASVRVQLRCEAQRPGFLGMGQGYAPRDCSLLGTS